MSFLGRILGANTTNDRELERQLRELGAENEDLRRRNREYFELIERIEKQRNEWKEMFFTQSAQHQTAQEMLQRQRSMVGEQLKILIVRVNLMLKAAGLPVFDTPKSLESFNEDVASKYGQKMKELAERMPEPVDGASERDRIAGPDDGVLEKNV